MLFLSSTELQTGSDKLTVLSHLSKTCFYWSSQGLACITNIWNTRGEIPHSGNVKALRVGWKFNNGWKCHPETGEGQTERAELHKLCRNVCVGQDKSKLLSHQSKIPHKGILVHANRGTATGRCETGSDIRAAVAVYLCGDQAAT